MRLHGRQHSKQEHVYALLRAAKDAGVPKVYIHFFGDGRDTDPKSGAGYMEELLGKLKEISVGEIATVVGRYYAMDRDKRWERNELALKGMVLGEGEESSDPVKTIKERYEKGENDEFLKPIVCGGKEARIQGKHCALNPDSAARHMLTNNMQTAILSSSSTIAPTASAKSPSFSATSTAPRYPTSNTPRSSWSP